MFGDILRPLIEPITTRVGRGFGRARITPNMMTTIGLVAVLACCWVIVSGRPVLGGFLLFPAVLLDVADGAIARATGRVTKWGSFYDSVCDRVADGALLASVAWLARDGSPRLLAAALAAGVASQLVPYARAKAESHGYAVASGPGERAERSGILILGLVTGYLEPAMWLMTALSAYTFIARCVTVRRQAMHA